MLLKKVKKIFKCFMVVVLTLTMLNLTHAEDSSHNILDMNDILFNVKGRLIEQNEDVNKIQVTIDIENVGSEDFVCNSIKSKLTEGIEYIENENSLFIKEDDEIVMRDQTISAHETQSYSYDIALAKDKSFDGTSWFINDNTCLLYTSRCV